MRASSDVRDARGRLSALLREIEADPGAGYRILVRKRVVAELRSPAPPQEPWRHPAVARCGNGEALFTGGRRNRRDNGGELQRIPVWKQAPRGCSKAPVRPSGTRLNFSHC